MGWRRFPGFSILVIVVLVAFVNTMARAQTPNPNQFPELLSRTGLYANIRTKSVNRGIATFSPQYPLWSDGARKKRWIQLPAGSRIDTSDMNRWVFPVGTRAWKEFSFRLPGRQGERRIETRLSEKIAPGQWRFATYLWNESETEATLVPEEGLRDVVEIAPGVGYDIPSRRACVACHGTRSGEQEGLAGFNALQLSPVRDRAALHAELESEDPNRVLLPHLIRARRLSHPPREWIVIPPAELEPHRSRVIGYFHGNCASCHNPTGIAARTGLHLQWDHAVARVEDSPAYRTAVGVATSRFQIPNLPPGSSYRIQPGAPSRSAILFRMVTPGHRMPPMATEIVDVEAGVAVRDFIRGLCAGGSCQPEPFRGRRASPRLRP